MLCLVSVFPVLCFGHERQLQQVGLQTVPSTGMHPADQIHNTAIFTQFADMLGRAGRTVAVVDMILKGFPKTGSGWRQNVEPTCR